MPNAEDVRDMVSVVSDTLDDLDSPSNRRRVRSIKSEMAGFNADPCEYVKYLGNPSLDGSGCGTHFYIIPADPIINDDIDNRQASNKATRFEKNLIGFTNTMTPNHARPFHNCAI